MNVFAGTDSYLVFAKSKQGDDLKHIGSLRAPSSNLAEFYATKIYDEIKWEEMCVVPSKNTRWARKG